MKHQLPPLPYAFNALAPFISEETLAYHYGKHHKGYVDKLNELIEGTQFEGLPLSEIVKNSAGEVFNNAAQAWNHEFFWKCLTPNHHQMSSEVLQVVERDFGSVDQFQDKWITMGSEVFGSGYIWLVEDGGKLVMETTHNADNPIRQGKKPILTCDLWEHAYYIDYRNERKRFLESFTEIINWNFVEKNLHIAHRAVA